MAVKDLTFETDARQALQAGVEKLAKAVKSTLGPRGRNGVIDKSWGGPTVTKDGVTVAEEIQLRDKAENMGVMLVKEAASKTSDDAGDGTTTATVLAEALFTAGLRFIASGVDANALVRGMKKGVEIAAKEITDIARPIDGKKDIQSVATISANNDPEIGKILADAFEKVGKDGVITVEEGKSLDTDIDVVEGMQFDRGYLSANFVTNPDEMKAELEKCLVLIHEDKIDSIQTLVPLLEKVMGSKKPLLIIAEDITGEALSTLVINKLRGTLQVAAVKAPGYGDRRKAMLQDIAVLTGAKPVMKDLGIKLDSVSMADLGMAKKIEITSDTTTILNGAGDSKDIQSRVEQIRREIDAATSDYDREKLQERLAKLVGGVAVVKVGAATEVEMKEKKARVEDALNATRAAVEEGIVPGGGTALLRCQGGLEKLDVGDEQMVGVAIVRRAIEEPLRQIAGNAGIEGSIVVEKVRNLKGSNGFNAATEEYEDLLAAGVIDPTKVVRTALQNAASVAALMLTTEALIAERPKDKEAPMPGGGGGMPGGMDF
jgi:chaperonin GroEL